MEQKNKIAILATFAKDRFINETTGIAYEQDGGPALYLTTTFTSEDISFHLRSSSVARVDILIKPTEELGKITVKPDLVTVSFDDVKDSFLVISTLLDEVNLAGLRDFKGTVFLDIQGYVRDGSDFGKKKIWNPPPEISDAIFCLKGTSEELRYIPDSFAAKQKTKLLIETKGKRGCEIFFHGDRIIIPSSRTVNAVHAVGAGDTFFAYFISRYIRGGDPRTSGHYAVEKTAEFLAVRTSDSQRR